MKELLSLTEVRQLTEDVENGVSPVLITGVSPVHRAQVEAALHLKTRRPLVVLCPDEREARRQAGDLRVLTGEEPLVLPARELQWRPMEASRQWENQRLAALYRLGSSPVVVTTPEALVQRCIPPRVLERTVLTLAVGQRWDLGDLTRRLAGAGYTRCDQVEGPGQFALRGGILDVFSPGMEQPVRCEFFDDEIDSLGIFDTATQRRVENRREALLLPAAEVLPGWQEGQAEQAARRLEAVVKRLARKQDTQALRELLTADAARLRQGMAPNGPDRCLAAVYPEKTTALDYLPENALVCVEESGRTAEALRGWLWQLKEDVSAGMEAGFLAGELADFAASEQELAARLEKRPTVQLDSLTTGRQLLAPKDLLQLTAKQLSSYGGSLELACTDLTHYLTSGYRVMVLCGGEVRARNLQQLLAERKIPATVDLTGEKAPEKGTVLIAVGALSAGCEYPEGRLAVLTEGQLTTPLSGRSKKPRPRRDSNQQKLQSYTDLTPGDLVVHAHHGIGRFVAMLRLPVDGVEKDYIKIAYAGQDVLYVPATSLDLVSKYIGPGEDNERTKLNKLGGENGIGLLDIVENRLVGIVTIDDAISILQDEASEDIAKMNAIGPSDKPYFKQSMWDLYKSRAPWLLFLMISSTFSSMVIRGYEDALAAVTVLTAYIPMLTDAGGNAGSQSTSTIIRGMAVGDIEPHDLPKILWREFRIAILCGGTLALCNFAKLIFLDGIAPPVAAVVCLTLICTVILSQLIGGLLPVIAEKLNFDPAVMASPLITTIVDTTTLLVYFNIARVLLKI